MIKESDILLDKNSKKPVLMTFDRWFATTSRPEHHKAGMLTYLHNNSFLGKRTKADWDNLFKTY